MYPYKPDLCVVPRHLRAFSVWALEAVAVDLCWQIKR